MKLSDWIWIILIVFLAIGWFYPTIGLIAVVCMTAPVIYGFWKGGRIWCGSFCPRGSFLGKLIGQMSKKGKIPQILASDYFRYLLLVGLLGNFAYGITKAQGNIELMGMIFVRIILLTTLIAIGLGLKYQPRTWCTICPMGTLSKAAVQARKVALKPFTKKTNNHQTGEDKN